MLFAESNLLTDSAADLFRVFYVPKSVRLFSTTSINYTHREVDVIVDDNGKPWIYQAPGDEIDDEWIG